ncbi:protein dopey-1 homolog isoform X2 [Thrips palmi]|uniref:Protein dopey-1 homolog isoform X2 n=1 Tax=Thrips palmi TaxID=161013 RepID=A0A6P8ZBK7_THRPL|nr:protein dopey-1 homolog isoform X2 [Thrips palmi]
MMSSAIKPQTVTMEEYELMKDSKYRVYVSAVDKALKNFEYTSEWADLISALGKLNKVLSSHMKFQVIPRRIKISKRLAQCMHPALPSGVHLKALETYDIIFKCMGTSRLSHELFIYSAGLFPLLGHAAMNVRPSLLTVYETHFVPLGERLCPALSGFLSGVLPGLEEGSDHFDRTNSLLEKVCDGVGAGRFYTCLWDCLSCNSIIRLPATCFILAHFNRKITMEDQLHIMGTDIDVMVNGLCTAVLDSSVLVQRSALDLLLVGFPLHNSQLVRSDMIRLVTASLNTILRRDMSLNRRLFAWLLGSEVNLSLLSPDHPLVKSPAVSYFQVFSQEMLVQAIRTSLNQVLADTPHDLKPFRILVSLLDKPEIGPIILDHILYEVFRTLYLASLETKTHSKSKELHRTTSHPAGNQELFKSVNLLFSSLEPAYIWQYAGSLVEKACRLHHDAMVAGLDGQDDDLVDSVRPVGSGQPCLIEVCQLVSCLLDAVPLESYIDTTLEHVPNLFLQIVNQLCSPDIIFTPRQLVMCLQLCSKVLSRVQPQPSMSKSNGFTDTTRPRSKTVSFGQRRNSDSSQTLALEGNVERLKDLSQSDHHLEVDVNQKMEVSNRSASVGARLDSDQPISNQLSDSKRQAECAPDAKSECQMFTPNLILDECRKQYQELFVVLITSSRMIEWRSHDFNGLFQCLMTESYSEVEKDDTSGLEKLLKACLSSTEPDYHSNECLMKTELIPFKFNSWKESGVLDKAAQLEAQSSDWEQVFCAACTLLVDLSTFPSFCAPSKPSVPSSTHELPPWLKLLSVCCCWLGQSPSMQLAAVSTLLDLIAVASKSINSQVSISENSQVTTVVLTPLLAQDEVQTLENCTCVMQVIAHWLWHHLSVGGPLEARSVALLQQLHDTVTMEDTVEATIGEFISQDDAEAQLRGFQSFATFWHASREITTKGRRLFLKSLLRMLDNLALPDSSPLKLVAQGWLLHTLLRGDVPRLLDPLLLPLLAPSTARVSVLRVSIQHRSTILPSEADKAEARIYAISSEDGNIIYHVSPVQSSDKHKHSQQSDSVRARRIFTVATLVRHCTYERDVASFEYCPSGLMSWAIPSALTGNYTVTNNDCETPTSFSSSSSDSSSAPATASVSLSEDLSRNMGSMRSNSRSSIYPSGDSLAPSSNVIVRVDGRLVVENPILKSLSSGFEEGEDEDLSDKVSNPATRGNTPVLNSVENELEESVSAEDYFSRTGSRPRSRADSAAPSTSSILTKSGMDTLPVEVKYPAIDKRKSSADPQSPLSLHPLHSHMLLYCGVYDSARTLYSLRTLRNALAANPRTFLSCAATTGVARTSSDLLNLLSRHRKSASGNNFHGDLGGSGRSHMYLEVLLLTCLYYIRSYYPSLGQMRLTKQEIEGNQQVQVTSLELLTLIFSELTSIVRDSGKGLANYVGDLLSRCKVQKVVLHCLVASVHDSANTSHPRHNLTFTEEIIHFNDPGRTESDVPIMSPLAEAYQIQLLKLLLSLTILEHQIQHQKIEVSSQQNTQANAPSASAPASLNSPSQSNGDITVSAAQKNSELKYMVGRPIPQQPMFVAAILSALRMQGQLRWLHQQWTTLVTCSLPFMGQSLAHVVLSVVRQLCDNLRALAPLYANTLSTRERSNLRLPADYTITQLEALTILCHYCLLDRNQQYALNQPLLSASAAGSLFSSGSGFHGMGPPSQAAQIFNNLVHVFMTTPLHQDAAQENVEPQLAARRALLYNLPQIISSTTTLWKAVTACSEKDYASCSVAGNARIVRHYLLEFLSPISLHHATNFLAAIAVVWQDRRQSLSELSSQISVAPEVVPEQQVLVDLISAIKAMPIDTLVQTLHQLVKSPPSVHGTNHAVCLEVSALELLLCYLRQGGSPSPLLAESWSSVLLLLRDGLQPGLPPPAQFLLLAVLNEFVQRCPSPSEKRDVRDLQDITTKLVESCGSIAGARLEQTTWLRRNLAVKEDQLVERETIGTGNASLCQYSIQAQTVLAEQLASLLDVTFGSQEKEKVVNILTSLLYNIIPYLRNHSPRNAASFYACSELLASLTAFQYTRKSWRRDVLDLLLEPALFQMESRTLPHWRAIIDNLMSHDTATFRDLMSRVSLGQGNSLSLFSSREQEYEQRAHLLKRLAFVILCSDMDQYQKYMPEIQERLAESLRLPQVVPAVQANVFLCFRVLLLRMSPHHVTSLWPVIISEMVQVFLQMEQELSTESEEFRQCNNSSYIRLVSALDLAWVSDRSNGLYARGHPHWLQLQLAAAHLLHLALQLPAHRLPQFQMYRWAFVGSLEPAGLNNNNASVMGCVGGASSAPPEEDPGRSLQFIPHVTRIARLMDSKYEGPVELPIGSALLPATQTVRCLQELHPFFSILSATGGHAVSGAADTPQALTELERAIEMDFLEPMPTR